MQLLDLNLSHRPYKNNTLLWLAYSAGFVALMLFTLWNVMSYRSHVQALDDLRAASDSIEGRNEALTLRDRSARKEISGYDLSLLHIQAEKANEVISWRAFSWTRLFNLMERVQPYDVRMASIRPVFKREGGRRAREAVRRDPLRQVEVAVEGIARSFSDFADFEHALQADSHFGDVKPMNLARSSKTKDEVVFTLKFAYFPDIDDLDIAPQDEGAAEETAAGDSDAAEQRASEPTEAASTAPAAPLKLATHRDRQAGEGRR